MFYNLHQFLSELSNDSLNRGDMQHARERRNTRKKC
jgi:hypothetical protein